MRLDGSVAGFPCFEDDSWSRSRFTTAISQAEPLKSEEIVKACSGGVGWVSAIGGASLVAGRE